MNSLDQNHRTTQTVEFYPGYHRERRWFIAKVISVIVTSGIVGACIPFLGQLF